MKKLLLATVLSLLLPFQADAGGIRLSKADLRAKALTSQVQAKISAAKKRLSKLATPLVHFHLSPAQPKVGEEVTAFVQSNTGFTDQELLLELILDHGSAVALEEPAKELWVADLPAMSRVGSHHLLAKLSIQDLHIAEQIREALTLIEAEIATLNAQIEEEADPVVKDELIAQRDSKVEIKNSLTEALLDLKAPIGEEEFSFPVSENIENPAFPRILRVSPNVVKNDAGSAIVVEGVNLEFNPELLINGVSIPTNGSNTEHVAAYLPTDLTEGVKDVEVRFTRNGVLMNAILKNAFFSTSQDIGGGGPTPIPDMKPVGVVGEPSTVNLGQEALVSGGSSYDVNNHAFRFEWRHITKPLGSNVSIGTVAGTEADYSFTPDLPGYYVLELRLVETVAPFMSSDPVLAVVEVNPPANRKPVAFVEAVSVGAGSTVTRQIQASDPDSWQSLGFFIKKQGTSGTATVSSTGLISYAAGNDAGSDSVEVLIVDNGSPQESTTVSLAITIGAASNLPPVVNTFTRFILAEGLPIQVRLLSPLGVSDSDGTITKIEWDFGDGTSESVPVATLATATHNYIAPGTYTITLKATDNGGAVTTRTQTFSIANTDIPTAKVALSAVSGAVPLTINFDASASTHSTGITDYRWLFGDGSPEQTGASFVTRTHTYNTPGIYSIRFRTRDVNGAQGESFIRVYAGVTPPAAGTAPIAAYKVLPNRSQLVGSSYFFDASASFDPNPNGSIATYAWNFGDHASCSGADAGCLASGLTTSYAFPAATNYFTSLQVSTPSGATSARLFQEVFAVNAGFAPRPLAQVNQTSGVAPFSISATGSASYDYDGTISSYSWSSGDFANCTPNCNVPGPTFGYTYNSPGVYFLSLRVTDNDRNAPTQATTITVNPSYQSMAKTIAAKIKALSEEDSSGREEQRAMLAGACARGAGEACYELGLMYQEDGDEYTAEKLFERACGLGYGQACALR